MIDSFTGSYRYLSNFHIVDIDFEGYTYRSTEHAYQAAKTVNEKEREQIRLAPTCRDAKRLGQKVTMRPDWEKNKVDVMYILCKQKFMQEPLRTALLATGEEELVEGNTWNDTFWGVCRGVGENHLGKILMRIRLEVGGEEADRWTAEDVERAKKGSTEDLSFLDADD